MFNKKKNKNKEVSPAKNTLKKPEEQKQEEKKNDKEKKKRPRRKKMKASSKPKSERDKNRRGIKLINFINGNILIDPRLRKQTPFILLLVVIVFLYIGVDYIATKRLREIDQLKIELEELRNEEILIKSQLDNYSRQSSIIQRLNDSLQIKPSRKPPVKLIVKENK